MQNVALAEHDIESLRREVERLRVLASRDRGVLDALVNHSPHGIIVCDPSGKWVLHNRAAERIWAGSASADSIEDWSKYRAFHPDGRPYAPDDWSMSRCLRDQAVIEAEEVHFQRFDDTHGILLGSCAPIFGPNGDLQGALTVFADITRLKETERALASANLEVRLLLKLAQATATADSEEQVFEPALDVVLQLLNVDRASILLYDANKVMRFRAWRGLSDAYRAAVDGHSPWKPDAVDPQPILVGDVHAGEQWAPYRETFDREGIRSLGFVPLLHQGRLLGKFMIYCDAPREFTARESEMAQTIAGHVAQSVERSRLYREERRGRLAAERLSAMLAAADAVGDSIDHAETVMALARLLVPGLADWCSVDLLDENGRLQPTASKGVRQVLETGEPILSRNVADEGARSMVLVPLVARGRRLGVLSLLSMREGRIYDETDLLLAEKIASRAALAIDNARLVLRMQRLQSLAASLAQATTPQEVGAVMVREGLVTLGAQVGFVTAPSADGAYLEMLAQQGLPAERAERAAKISQSTRAPVRDVVKSGEPQWYTSFAQFAREYPEIAHTPHTADRMQSSAFLPLEIEGRTIGAVAYGFAVERTFSDDEKSFIRTLARHCAQALDRARLLEAERQARVVAEQAELALKQADRRKDEFLALLAHELRNPLGPVRNAVAILRRRGPADPSLERVRDTIDRQVTHMTRMVDDLLDVSRITRGKILLRTEAVDLSTWVRNSLEDQRSGIESAGLTLHLDIPEEPIFTEADPTRISQAIGNLIHNAIKFSDSGSKLYVQLTKNESEAFVSIRDTGVGMTTDTLLKIFEPFSQEQRTLSRSRGGLGLGLALVKGLVELHRGSVRASSQGLGQGSEFVITLPLLETVGDRSKPSSPAVSGVSLRVMIVEDNTDAADTMAEVLTLMGHETIIARDGRAAIDLARQNKPQVVLCDLGLPGGVDGFDVAKALRSDAATASSTLIALTGYGQDEDRARARSAGFDLHFTKPVDLELLEKTLRSTQE